MSTHQRRSLRPERPFAQQSNTPVLPAIFAVIFGWTRDGGQEGGDKPSLQPSRLTGELYPYHGAGHGRAELCS